MKSATVKLRFSFMSGDSLARRLTYNNVCMVEENDVALQEHLKRYC